uniref:Ubiquilin-1-like protein n=1 Tax=Amazona collaria TaxID=241587 RepID=A0A8B9GFR3_9PSIT
DRCARGRHLPTQPSSGATLSSGKGAAQTSPPLVTMDSPGTISVTVKTLKQKEQFEVAQDSTIQELKEEVSKRFQTPPKLLVLVFAGKVLQDQDTLSQHGVRNGVSIHVVIRSQNRAADSLADLGSLDLNTIRNNTFLLGFLLGVTGVHLLGLGSTGVLDLVSSIEEQDVSIPGLLTEVLQSPMVSTDLIRGLIMSIPQLQQLAEENPEIGHILSNLHTIREMLEASSSPAIVQEMIRNYDLAMNNLESIPGGYSALEQLYREIEEPILSAVEEHMVHNLFASPESRPSPSGARLPAHTENRSPLPNPWALEPGGAGRTAQELPGGSVDGSSAGLNLGAVVPNSGAVQAMVRQLAGTPELMYNLGRALAEPGSPAQEVLSPHAPSDGSSLPLDQQQLPPQLGQAEISSLLRSPRALQALLQIQLGLQTLSVEAPDFLLSLEDAQMEPGLENMDESPRTETGDSASVGSGEEGSMFEWQMEQLSAMGFQDQGSNLQALLDVDGELHAAAEILAKAQPAEKMP